MSRTSPLPDGEVDHDPGDDEGAEELPAEAAHVLDALGHLEDAAVVELLRAGVGVVLGQTRVVGGQVGVHDGPALNMQRQRVTSLFTGGDIVTRA